MHPCSIPDNAIRDRTPAFPLRKSADPAYGVSLQKPDQACFLEGDTHLPYSHNRYSSRCNLSPKKMRVEASNDEV
jgi:hypothetical protein